MVLDAILSLFRLVRQSRFRNIEQLRHDDQSRFDGLIKEYADRLSSAVLEQDRLKAKYEPPSEALGVTEPWDMNEFLARIQREREAKLKVFDMCGWNPRDPVVVNTANQTDFRMRADVGIDGVNPL